MQELIDLLDEWLDIGSEDEPCRNDHDGYCQAHFHQQDCIVPRTREAIKKFEKKIKKENKNG